MIDEQVLRDTIESITSNYEAKLEIMQLQIEQIAQEKAEEEQQRLKNRKYWLEKKRKQDPELFIKQYQEGWSDMLMLKRENNLSFADAGKFAFLCMHIEKDTGLIVKPKSSEAMRRIDMANAIGDHKQHFYKTLDKFMELGLVQRRTVGAEEFFYINPKYAFNGISKVAAQSVIFNNCTFGDNATITNSITQ